MTKTYRFYLNMTFSDEIEVEADSYDEACDEASIKGSQQYSVLTPDGWSTPFDDFQIEDSYIPD